jgi:hypothetical protein
MNNSEQMPQSCQTDVSGSAVNRCPEFPFFGASYPDARCVDGELWDLDKCDENGLYSSGDNPPCPFCNTEAFIDYHTDIDDKELEEMNKDESLSEEDKKEILDSNRTKEDATKLAEAIKERYR